MNGEKLWNYYIDLMIIGDHLAPSCFIITLFSFLMREQKKHKAKQKQSQF